MAAVSAWGKPSSWAQEAEEQDATNALQEKSGYSSSDSHQSNDFPSLSIAAAAKIPKKKKNKTLSLAEFNAVGSAAATKSQPIFSDETLNLPTGPRERTAEEIQNSRYGRRGEDSSSRWGNSRVSDESSRRAPREPREPLGPSRADEVDDWGKTKKAPAGFERRESGSSRGGGGFFGESRADESDSWVSKKGTAPPMGGDSGRRERRGYDLFNRDGSGADSESWGKRREDSGYSSVSGGRPRIVLQPRTLPIENVVVSNNGNGEMKSAEAAAVGGSKGVNPFGGARPREEVLVSNNGNGEMKSAEAAPVGGGSKGVNPFGGARPREEVLKEKGKDWKEIDQKLENTKIQEVGVSNGRRDFGRADKTERAWRKPVADEGTKPQIEEAKSSSRTNSLEEQTSA